MRLVLARRSDPAQPWDPLWAADVVAENQQVVRFISRETGKTEAAVGTWAYIVPEGLIACGVELTWTQNSKRQLRDSVLIQPNQTTSGANVEIDGVEYQLFHAASVLQAS